MGSLDIHVQCEMTTTIKLNNTSTPSHRYAFLEGEGSCLDRLNGKERKINFSFAYMQAVVPSRKLSS